MYGHTHTTTSVTLLQTTLYRFAHVGAFCGPPVCRDEARDLVRSFTGAGEQDAVIFSGSGSTGAVHTLVSALGLQQEEQVEI